MNNKTRTSIGGQALMEGVLMRGPEKTAVVVRTPEGLKTEISKTPNPKEKYPVLGWFFIRGVVNFVLSLMEGSKALSKSTSLLPEMEEEPTKFEKWLESKFGSKAVEKLIFAVAVVLGLGLSIAIFTLLPTFLGSLLSPLTGDGFYRNLCETLIRLVVLIGYMSLVSLMPDIKRVFAYHGAEHKAIACYEAGGELTPENAKNYSRRHPRCGTSFLLTVFIIALFVFMISQSLLGFLPWDNILLRILFRLSLLPFVVAVSYEINRVVGRYDALRFIAMPGFWLQNITTREPDEEMLEVAIESLKAVIPEDRSKAEWGKE